MLAAVGGGDLVFLAARCFDPAAGGTRRVAVGAVTSAPAAIKPSAANSPGPATAVSGQPTLRLTNTAKSIGQLVNDPHAILLQNAFLDTSKPLNLSIPEKLRLKGDPGAYIVQARGSINNAFRALVTGAGGRITSYIPNDACPGFEINPLRGRYSGGKIRWSRRFCRTNHIINFGNPRCLAWQWPTNR